MKAGGIYRDSSRQISLQCLSRNESKAQSRERDRSGHYSGFLPASGRTLADVSRPADSGKSSPAAPLPLRCNAAHDVLRQARRASCTVANPRYKDVDRSYLCILKYLKNSLQNLGAQALRPDRSPGKVLSAYGSAQGRLSCLRISCIHHNPRMRREATKREPHLHRNWRFARRERRGRSAVVVGSVHKLHRRRPTRRVPRGHRCPPRVRQCNAHGVPNRLPLPLVRHRL